MTTIAEALNEGTARLEGIADHPRREARLLLAHAIGADQNDLIRDPNRWIDPANYRALLDRRAAREPIALILGHREFWSLDFRVSPATLIPRPDSETLIEAALAFFADRPSPARILDLGTGTGCLLLALLHEFPQAWGIGTDLNSNAAALARDNARTLGLAQRSSFVAGNWFGAIAGRFDLIVSNPPYIPAADIPGLMPEVSAFEPRGALDGGTDGYDAYRAIIPTLPRHLAPGGAAILEIGAGQAKMVARLANAEGFVASSRADLGGISRAILLSTPNR